MRTPAPLGLLDEIRRGVADKQDEADDPPGEDLVGSLDAVVRWEVLIEEDQVRRRLPGGLRRGRAVPHDPENLVPQSLQLRSQALSDENLIRSYEDP